MWTWLNKLSSLPRAYQWTGKWLPWLLIPGLTLLVWGLYAGLVQAPTDYQQGDSYRIIYIHVPSAWMSLFVYLFMATCAGMGLIWRTKLAEIFAKSAAVPGAWFTFLALVTGSIWGKPTWGTWWEWDARLTSELILLFLYLGFIALQNAIEDPRSAARASGILALVGVVNVPIIHYSVEWWHSLHQGPLITRDGISLGEGMVAPLFMMVGAFQLLFFAILILRTRAEILQRERRTQWVKDEVLKA